MHVLVIGSGLAGVASAWFLRHYGAQVTVVDRCNAAAMETSHANAGMLTPSMSDPWNHPGLLLKLIKWIGREESPLVLRPSALPVMAGWGVQFLRHSTPARHRENTLKNLRLARYSLETLRQLRGELNIEYDALANGTLKFFRDRETYSEFLQLAEMLSAHGVPFRALDGGEVVALEPSLAPIQSELAGGLHFPDDESGNARRFCESLAARAREHGVEFRYGENVQRLIVEKGRFRALETDAGHLDADACVVAAGSYAPLLLKPLGIHLPVRPVKGYSITLPFGEWRPRPRMPLIDETLHLAATPLGDALRIAGTAELAGWDTRVRRARIDRLVTFVRRIFPTFPIPAPDQEIGEWSGLRPMSSDGVPILGPSPIAGLHLATGYGHLGWTLSSGAGKLVAAGVVGQPLDLDLAPYAWRRPRR